MKMHHMAQHYHGRGAHHSGSAHHTDHHGKHHSGKSKIAKVMREGYAGKLHSGSHHGPIVTNPQQMKAIAMSEGRKAAHGHKRRHK